MLSTAVRSILNNAPILVGDETLLKPRDAMFDRGVHYDESRDYAKARDYYRRAAKAGHVGAMVNLGVLYEKGRGGPPDYAKTREWYQRAADAGSEEAEKDLRISRVDSDSTVSPNGLCSRSATIFQAGVLWKFDSRC
jgi:TPR repeat protein